MLYPFRERHRIPARPYSLASFAIFNAPRALSQYTAPVDTIPDDRFQRPLFQSEIRSCKESPLVDSVEQAGWGERRPHPADRRVKVVAMTDKGRAAYAEVRRVLDTPPAWFDALTPEEMSQLTALLAKLQAAEAERA